MRFKSLALAASAALALTACSAGEGFGHRAEDGESSYTRSEGELHAEAAADSAEPIGEALPAVEIELPVNEADYRVEIKEYRDGALEDITRSVFDVYGNEIESEWHHLGMELHYITKTAYRYNENGTVAEKYEIDGLTNMIESREIYQYNADGSMAKADVYENGVLKYTSIYEYDRLGGFVGMASYYPEGLVTSFYKYVNEYDSNGSRIVSYEYDFDTGELVSTYYYEYGANGETLKSSRFYEADADRGAWNYEYAYTYDDSGNRVRTEYIKCDEEGTVTQTHTEFSYDEKNRVIKETHFDENSETDWYRVYEYEELNKHKVTSKNLGTR